MIKIEDLEQLARDLINDRSKEVKFRCAISRAYYAAYHYCREAADSWCEPLPENQKTDKGEHAKLFLRLKTCSKEKAKSENLKLMALEAEKLRNFRLTADYDLLNNKISSEYSRSLHLMAQVRNYHKVIYGP